MSKGRKMTVTGSTVLEFLDKYPEMASTTLARLIHRSSKGHLFNGVEHIRSIVRQYRGANGSYNRKNIVRKEHYEDTPVYDIPTSDYKPPSPFMLSPSDNRIGLLPDLHIPWHDPVNLRAAIDAIAKRDPTTIILTGDTMDCYKLSAFDQNPDEADIGTEVARTREFLGYIRQRFQKARIIYMEGNHEYRLKRWMFAHPEMFPLVKTQCSIPKVLDFDDLGVEWVQDKQLIKAGPHLTIAHGHELNLNSCGVSPARAAFLKAKECIIVSHLHKVSQSDEVTVSGKVIASWSLGCLCGLRPPYLPLNNWSAGAGYVELNGKDFDVSNLRIINGKVKGG